MTCESSCPFTEKVILKVNDNEVELNPFVQEFIARTIKGMVSSLRDVEVPRTISLEISKKTT
jgi:hypothetical protein